MNITKILPIAVPVAALAVLAGCTPDTGASGPVTSGTSSAAVGSDSSSSSSSSGGGSGPASAPQCPSASAVGSALGPSGLTESAPTVKNPVTECVYTDDSTGQTVTIQMISGADSSQMGTEQQKMQSMGEQTQPVSGVGDQAFSGALNEGSASINTLATIKDSLEVLIVSPASVSAESTLASQIFSQAS